jgi:hypothetical protein
MDDIVGSRVYDAPLQSFLSVYSNTLCMYPCVPLGALSVVSATSSELFVAELIEKVEKGTWEGLTGWLNSLNQSGMEARSRAAAAAHALHLAGVAVQHVTGIDACGVRDINDVHG